MRSRFIIAAQSGVVIGLLGLTVYQARQLREAHRQMEGAELPAPEMTGSTSARPVRLRLQQLPPIQIRNQTVELDWRTVESEDYATYVANLRRIRCPEETIRDIIRADIDKLFREKRRALQPTGKDWEFWRSPDEAKAGGAGANAEDLEREQILAELEQERRRLLATLLGTSAITAELEELRAEAVHDRALQFLDPAKRETVAAALARYRQAEEEARGLPTPSERQSFLEAAERALEDTFAKSLTPEEREQYELRSSPMADELREQLRGFSSTREEFETLFRLQREGERQASALAAAADDPQRGEKLEALEQEQQQNVRQALGEQRFKEYQRARDPDYQTLYSLALGHQVPTEVAGQVWDMRAAVEVQTDRVRANPLLTVDQKVRALEAIRETTQSSIVDVLGEPLLDAYRQNGGSWLESLTAPIDLGESGIPIIPPPLPPGAEGTPQQAFTPPPP
ncbi:MAG: hypothetical protein IT580_05760 [Verrucomicrobiales bacterium]|nr:hypothetical protein [Verrucomicrobiales bacterium]